jgi:hypothetical protein
MDVLSNKSEKEEWFVTQIPYEKIVISGRGYGVSINLKDNKIILKNGSNQTNPTFDSGVLL